MRPPEETVAVDEVRALGADKARMLSSGARTWRHASSPVCESTEASVEAWRGGSGSGGGGRRFAL